MHLVRKFKGVGEHLVEFAKASRSIKKAKKESQGQNTGPGTFESEAGSAKQTNPHGAETGEVSKPEPAKTPDNTTELEPGEKDSWNKELNGELKPNHKYKVGEYLYETDSKGRVTKVSCKLDLNMRDRNTYQQGKSAKEAGIKDGLADYDGGHLVASIFNGAGEQINYAPMNSNLNRGARKSMENK